MNYMTTFAKNICGGGYFMQENKDLTANNSDSTVDENISEANPASKIQIEQINNMNTACTKTLNWLEKLEKNLMTGFQ